MKKFAFLTLVCCLCMAGAFAGEPGVEEGPMIIQVAPPVLECPPVVEAETIIVPQEVNAYAVPAEVQVQAPVAVEVVPQVSVRSQPVTIIVEPQVRVYGAAPVTVVEEPAETQFTTAAVAPQVPVSPIHYGCGCRCVCYCEPAESANEIIGTMSFDPDETAWDRFKGGLKQTVTFWTPMANCNDPGENATALENAEGFIEQGDKTVRNFFFKGVPNSGAKFIDGVWNTGTFIFPSAS